MPIVKFLFRRGTTTEWESANPILSSGELGLDTTLNQFKIGDGTSLWNDLSYYVGGQTTGGVSVVVSSTAPASPGSGDLWYDQANSQLLIYYINGGSGNWVPVSPPLSETLSNVSISSNPPASPNEGDFWYDDVNAQLLIYYVDGESANWVTVSTSFTVSALSGLTDVDLTNIEPDQILAWDASLSKWTPRNYIIPDIAGSVGELNNAILRADSSTGKFKASSVVLEDNGTISSIIVKNYTESRQVFTTSGDTTLSLANGHTFRITLGGNHQLTMPTVTQDLCASFMIILECNSYSPTWGSSPAIKWLTTDNLAPELATSLNLVNVLSFVWDHTDSRWLGFSSGKEL